MANFLHLNIVLNYGQLEALILALVNPTLVNRWLHNVSMNFFASFAGFNSEHR